MIKVTPKDALRAKNLQPGWQICMVDKYTTKQAGTDGSTLHCYELIVSEGQYKGVPLNEYVISEKAIGMGKNFFIACGMPAEMWARAESGETVEFDEELPVGKKLKVMVKPEAYQGRMLNKASDFLAIEPSLAKASV
jgi:hypothetical protein